MLEWLPILMFIGVCGALLLGYPVAFTLAGVALLFASGGIVTGNFDPALLKAMPERVYGTMINQTLIAVPLFVLMGIMLERTGLAERLLDTMARLFGGLAGGLGISVVVVGMLL
ncbi:MAG TPA: C4-dicarboxylate ABC transporter, partial [Gammaproteobacteria bacterium]|nr:C4-dicarboxylate ABC transporter [Gammaproteobacteria bacterium]